MSSAVLSGISGISESTLQTRYQKALKQINKLIEMNRQLKEALTENEQQVQQLQAQLSEAQQSARELDEENNILEQKYMEIDCHYREIQEYCSELEAKFEESQHCKQQYEEKLRDTETKLSQNLQNEILKNQELAKQIEIINQMYQESQVSLEQQFSKASELETQRIQLTQTNTKLQAEHEELSQYVKQKNIDYWQNEVEKANITIEKLTKECQNLKSKQIDAEVMDERRKVQSFIGFKTFYDPQQSEAVRMLVSEYKKKCKGLQNEKKEVERKYRHLKSMSESFIPQNCQRKIDSLEKLTERQQAQIGRLIETYDTQLTILAAQNQKLKQSYYSVSQELSKKSLELTVKQKQLINLKYTTDKIHFENESLKKVNLSLTSQRTEQLKELEIKHNKIPHAQSYTIFEKKSTEDYTTTETAASMKKKSKQDQHDDQNPLYNAQSVKKSPGQSAGSSTKAIPFNLSYNSDPADFKFIQSVNIIHGFNVNLNDNQSKNAGK